MLPMAERGLGYGSVDGEASPSELAREVLDVAEFPATGSGRVVEETGEMRGPRESYDRGTGCVPLGSVNSWVVPDVAGRIMGSGGGGPRLLGVWYLAAAARKSPVLRLPRYVRDGDVGDTFGSVFPPGAIQWIAQLFGTGVPTVRLELLPSLGAFRDEYSLLPWPRRDGGERGPSCSRSFL